MIELAVNELSYLTTSAKSQAKSWYDIFFGICRKIEKDHKTKVILKCSQDSNIGDTSFHPSYPFKEWLKTQTADEMRSIVGMIAQVSKIDYPYYKVYDMEGHGISYAYENDTLLISLNTHPQWQVNNLSILKEYMNEDTAEIESETKDIYNCFENNCIHVHQRFIRSCISDKKTQQLREITSGEVLWRERKRFFPSLIFCDSVEAQIWNLSGSPIANLRRHLQEFENYFSNWTTGDFDIDSITGEPRLESETRINKFTDRLIITCPDGKNRLFNYHCNWREWGYRMHFYPDHSSRKCIIGYVGKKIV